MDDVADDQPDGQRHRRHRQEVAEGQAADLADLGGLPDRADAQHDRAEDDRADHHLDQVDEAGAERLELLADVGGDEADHDAGEHGDDDGEIQVVGAVPALTAAVVVAAVVSMPQTVACVSPRGAALRSFCSPRRLADAVTAVARRVEHRPAAVRPRRSLVVVAAGRGAAARAPYCWPAATPGTPRSRPGAPASPRPSPARRRSSSGPHGRRPVGVAAAVRGIGPAGHRHRLRRGHGARPHPLHAPDPGADRPAVHRHYRRRRCAAGAFTETHTARSGRPCGRSCRCATRSGAVIGLVSVGITTEAINQQAARPAAGAVRAGRARPCCWRRPVVAAQPPAAAPDARPGRRPS